MPSLTTFSRYLGCLFFFLSASFVGCVNAGVVYSINYESPPTSIKILETMTTRPNEESIRVDCSHARLGRCSVKTTVTDEQNSISAGAFRAESDTMSILPTRYSPGQKLRYKFSVLFPADWQVAPRSSIDIIWQFKRFETPPDMFIAAKENSLVLRVGKQDQVLMVSPLPLGTWIDVEMDVYWSNQNNGSVVGKLSKIDGSWERSFVYSGPTTRNAEPKSAYIKWGLYKPGKTDGTFTFPTRRIWHDEISVERLN